MLDTDPPPGSHHVNDPRWPSRVTVACANFSTAPRDKAGSVDHLIAVATEAAERGADLVVFPELAINTWGHCEPCATAHAPCDWHLSEAEIADGPSAQRIAVIDLHTGLGPYGYGEVINDHPLNSAGYRWAESWYRDNAQSTVLGESVSSIKQGLLDYHWHRVIGDRGCFVTLEFGTYSLKRLLVALINEQLLHNHAVQSGAARDINQGAIQRLKQFFYPGESSWQQQVLFRGRQVISLALKGIMQ